MTPEQINYIRKRARDGNKPLGYDGWTLTQEALTSARLADALEQANEVAEDMWDSCPMEVELGASCERYYAMRQNRRELLGDE